MYIYFSQTCAILQCTVQANLAGFVLFRVRLILFLGQSAMSVIAGGGGGGSRRLPMASHYLPPQM